MYNVGDLIIYSSHGICRINDICEKTYSGMTRNYYVIHPIEDHTLIINTPVDNDLIQGIMNRNEAEEILESFKLLGAKWIEKPQDRTRIYNDIVKTGNRKEISKIINTLMRKKYEVERIEKKLSDPDRRLLIFIQSILFMELAIALETSVDEIFEEITRLLDIHEQPTIQSL